MNSLNLHIAYVEAHPDDKTAALSLVDHFQEEHGWSRWQALRTVVRTYRDEKDNRQIAACARKCQLQTISSEMLLQVIGEEMHVSGYSAVRLMFIRGFAPAKFVSLQVMPGAENFLGHTIAIGAREYLRRFRRTQKSMRAMEVWERREYATTW